LITVFCQVDEQDVICRVWEADIPDVGPPPRVPTPRDGTRYEVLNSWVNIHNLEDSLVPTYVNGECVFTETKTLEEIKSDKNSEINKCRLAANRSTFPFGGKNIACDELSRSDIDAVNGIVALTGSLPPNWVGVWKATDNSYVPVADLSTWTAFYVAMVSKGSENFAYAQQLKTELASATTHADVKAISW
jgi:hypothetical protein